jgi:hypothetical protein
MGSAQRAEAAAADVLRCAQGVLMHSVGRFLLLLLAAHIGVVSKGFEAFVLFTDAL